MLTPSDIYHGAESWLLSYGWTPMVGIALAIIGVTIWLIASGRAVALATWLVYLLSP